MNLLTATIYPYSKGDIQFFRYKSMLKDFQPVYAVSPPGWGLCGKDVTALDGGAPSNITITENLSDSLQNSDVLVITSFEQYVGQEGGLTDTLKLAIQLNKKIFLYDVPETEEDKQLIEEAERLELILGNSRQDNANSIKCTKFVNHCDDLEAPVTLIVGQGIDCSKFEVQLGLRKELLSRNYKISQIGSRPYCEAFGFHSFPQFMFSKELSEAQKIVAFNRFVKEIEKVEKPDIIIVGIPGGIMPIMQKAHNDFGILQVEVAAALEPDTVIYTLYSNLYSTEYFKKSQELIYHRLNHAQTSCFVMSNSWIDYGAFNESGELRILKFDKAYNELLEKHPETPTVSIFDKNVHKTVADGTLCILEGYSTIECF